MGDYMKLFLFGAGKEGEKAIADIGKENICCVIDNYKTGMLSGVEIRKLSELDDDITPNSRSEMFFFITSKKHRYEIADELINSGYDHFAMYEHIERKSNILKALNSSQWGEIYNTKFVDDVVFNVYKNKKNPWTEEILKLSKVNDCILEIGCGSGETILQLARQKRICTAIDYSQSSIDLLNIAAKKLNISVSSMLYDARQKLPFGKKDFDIVFQAGLLEHFNRAERVSLLKLWRPVCKKMISLIPNAASIAYRAGKCIKEENGDWLYGKELPQHSMIEQFIEAGYENIQEYTIGLEHSFQFLPADHYLRVALEKWFRNHPEDSFEQGYLLCTIGENI